MDRFRELLSKATGDEVKALAKILGAKAPTPDGVIDGLRRNARSLFGRLLDPEPSYKDILRQVAGKLGVSHKPYHSCRQIEIRIAQKVLQTVWEKMTPEQREKMEQEWRERAQKFDKTGALVGATSIFAALTVAQLSGFGVYLLASTSLAAIIGVVGMILPFAVYTAMSSAIAVIIGPVGWIGAGLFAIWKLTGPNYRKLTQAILYICVLRSKCEPL